MSLEKIFVDFNNTDSFGRIRLTTKGSLEDIQTKKIKLIEGKQILLDDEDEMKIIGILKYSDEENIWVAEIHWNDFKTKTKI